MIYLGIDCGTQSTKTIALDADSGRIIASAAQSYEVLPGLPPGHLEQNPSTWVQAVDATIQQVLEALGTRRAEVRGIGISGQQHGFVALDRDGASHPPRQTLVRYIDRRGMRSHADAFRRRQGRDRKSGHGHAARIHRAENSLAETARAGKLRAAGHRASPARLPQFLPDRPIPHGIWRRLRHGPDGCPQPRLGAGRSRFHRSRAGGENAAARLLAQTGRDAAPRIGQTLEPARRRRRQRGRRRQHDGGHRHRQRRAGPRHRQPRHVGHDLCLQREAGGRSRRAKSPAFATAPTRGCRWSAR